jgi:hypothetical protein
MSHGNEMICQPVTLSGYAEWPKVADAVIEAGSPLKQFVAAQGKKATPLFVVLSLQAPRQGEAHGLVFAPATLANVMSDPQAGSALLFALKEPGKLAQSPIAMRLRIVSIQEMNEETQARRP